MPKRGFTHNFTAKQLQTGLPERDWDRWLDPDAPVDQELLTRPPDVRGIRMREVSALVNNVRNNGPESIEPVDLEPEQATLL